MNTLLRRTLVATAATGMIVVGAAAPASAHPHKAAHAHQGAGQVIANGQLHGAFTDADGDGVWTSCSGDAAAYGLETAHHGPDSGTPGKGDGCYGADGNPRAGADVENDAIR